jgi:S1-C subfamily serine protease
MFSILYPQIQYQPGSFDGGTIDSRMPTSFSSTGGMIMEGALFVNSINDIKDSDIASREMGYTGGSLKGITTRQIPGGPRLYKKNAPGVVFIANLDLSSFGSGSIISDDGDIITNWHVVEGNEKMLVWFYDKNITKIQSLGENTTVADVIGVDRERDLALLKIQTEKYELTPLALGEEYRLEVAQDVFAIGHPETQIWTFSYGVVSQLRDNYKWGYSADEKHVADVIQTQTPINPGNSGGPLFNEKGKLIGVNTFRQDGQGLNFAVSIGEVRSFYEGVKNGLFKPDPDDLTTKSKDSNWEALDINDNGVPDGYRSEDGDLIIVMVDENEDDILDVMLMNFDGDDKWDAQVYDKDGDEFPEYWLIDRNGNGELDNPAIDTDKDGYPDYFL